VRALTCCEVNDDYNGINASHIVGTDRRITLGRSRTRHICGCFEAVDCIKTSARKENASYLESLVMTCLAIKGNFHVSKIGGIAKIERYYTFFAYSFMF
jgi:hypothetical protein